MLHSDTSAPPPDAAGHRGSHTVPHETEVTNPEHTPVVRPEDVDGRGARGGPAGSKMLVGFVVFSVLALLLVLFVYTPS